MINEKGSNTLLSTKEGIPRPTLDHFKIPNTRVDLTPEFHAVMPRFYTVRAVQDQLIQVIRDYGDHDLVRAIANTKAKAAGAIKVRPRMITLHHIVRLTGVLVVSTDNLSELWMGFRP